jgi:hypothetical protein
MNKSFRRQQTEEKELQAEKNKKDKKLWLINKMPGRKEKNFKPLYLVLFDLLNLFLLNIRKFTA